MPATSPRAKAAARIRVRRWNEERYAEVRAWLDRVKLESGCVQCGYRDHPAALEFDHRDPLTKSFGIATSMTRSRAAIEREIAKCDVLCANCHRVRTASQAGTLGVGKATTHPTG